jgi:cell division septation protein DedD
MRNVFFALVLANLGFAAWHSWYSPTRVPHSADTDLPKLTLVRELPPDIADRRDANATVPEVHLPTDDAALAKAQQAGDAGQQRPAPEASRAASAATPSESATPGSKPAGHETPAAGPVTAAGPAAAAGRDSVAAAPAPARGASGATRCTSVGPFRDLAQAATAAATLRMSGYQPTQRVADGDIWIGYWIYIDAIATEAEANAILAKVRSQGITESYVIPNSDSGNLVSLGVFGEIGNVTRRREQVRGLGYDPKVVDRTRRGTVYWVDVVLTADQTLDFEKLQTPGRIQRLEQRACETPGR